MSNNEEKETFQDTGQFLPSGRPVYQNQFGDFVTERTITEFIPELGGWYNIPTFYNGRILDPREAIGMVINSGGKDPVTMNLLKPFESVNEAVKEAENRSYGLGGFLSERFRSYGR
jgi:hypothetical protein